MGILSRPLQLYRIRTDESFSNSKRRREGGGFRKKDIEKEKIPKKEASRSRWLKYFGTSVAAAAIIAFLIVGIQKIAQPQPECYAVIDGKVYTDQEFVHNEALDALEDVSADSEDPFSALDMMKQSIKR